MRKQDVLVSFGANVRALRTERDISQEKLAEFADLDRTYVSSLERGQRNVGVQNIVKLADALDVTPSRLLKGLGMCNE